MNKIITEKPEAIILCGGRGARLKPITDEIPKPLVPINNKPILHYVIEHLISYQINKIHLATGYKSYLINDFIRNHQFNANILIHDTGDVDIIVRLQRIFECIEEKNLLGIYGDTISDVNINKLIDVHSRLKRLFSATVWPLKLSYGVIEIDENDLVTSFQEKPRLDKWINIGYFIFDSKFKSSIFRYKLFEEFLVHTVKKNIMYAFRHEGLHITVNTLNDLEEAKKNIKKIIIE